MPPDTPVSTTTSPRSPGNFFAGRVYAPSATLSGDNNLNVFFARYHTSKPKNGLGDYRTIGRISLHSDQRGLDASTNDPRHEGGDR